MRPSPSPFSPWQLPQGFGIHLILAMAAILCLPRQFHVAIVEFRDRRELALARWLFPAYLAVFAVLVMPIALAGLTQFGIWTAAFYGLSQRGVSIGDFTRAGKLTLLK